MSHKINTKFVDGSLDVNLSHDNIPNKDFSLYYFLEQY